MSYCRFIDADAYIYYDVRYGLYCCACSLMPLKEADMSIFGEFERFFINEGFIAGEDYNKMLVHIAEHRAAGDYIPEDVDERLIEERDSLHDKFCPAHFSNPWHWKNECECKNL
jgi:hypothetical protein